jgi:hypothetical protein
MRRSIVISAVAAIVIGLGATPALAHSGKPRPPQPITPPGLVQSDVERPAEATTPRTGSGNKDNSPNF